MEGSCSVTSFAPTGCTLPSCFDGSCTSIESLDDGIMCKQVASLFRMLFGSALNRALVNRRCRMWRTSVDVNASSQGETSGLESGET